MVHRGNWLSFSFPTFNYISAQNQTGGHALLLGTLAQLVLGLRWPRSCPEMSEVMEMHSRGARTAGRAAMATVSAAELRRRGMEERALRPSCNALQQLECVEARCLGF